MDDQNNKVASGVQSPAPVAGRPLTAEEALQAIAPFLGATDANDWRGLRDDDALSMPVKIPVGHLRAIKDVLSRPASEQPVEAIGAGREEQVNHLAATLDKSPDEIRRALRSLEDKGLIALSPASPARTPMGEGEQ